MIVVAHYQEDLNWLHGIPDVLVYSKGPHPPPGAIQLHNQGREACTYLDHLIRNYDNLAPVTLFTQGHPFDHVHHVPGMLSTYKSTKTFQSYGIPLREGWHTVDYHPEIKQDLHAMHAALCPGESPPTQNVCGAGAIFAVTAECIRRHPRDYYERAKELCLAMQWGPWCMERLWHLVLH